MNYDVFISYRRLEGNGLEIARIIDSQIDKSVWFRSFLDYNELNDEEWSPKIFQAIDSAPVFLFVLTPGSLNRCVDKDDCVRQEILYAVEKKKHIVPVNPDGKVKWNEIDSQIREKIPEEIRKALFDNQQSEITLGQLFAPSIRKLVKERIKPYVPRVILLKRLVYTAVCVAIISLLLTIGFALRKNAQFKNDYQRYEVCLNRAGNLIKEDQYSEIAVNLVVEADSLARKYKYSKNYSLHFGDESKSMIEELSRKHKKRASDAYVAWETQPNNQTLKTEAVDCMNLALRLGNDEDLDNKKRRVNLYHNQ